MGETKRQNRSGCTGHAGTVLWTLFGLVFVVVGAVATWAATVTVVQNQAVRFWDQTTCTITTSNVGVGLTGEVGEAEGRPLGFTVSYTYRAGGATQRGHRLRPTMSSDPESPEEAYRLAARYPVGAEVPCYVHPQEPTAAYLEPASPWQVLVILATLVFVIMGLIVLGAVWWPKGQRDAAMKRVQAITSRDRKPGQGTGCMALFFFVFFLAGAGFFIPFFALPGWQAIESRSWPTAPATVIESGVESHSSDDGTTYSVEVLFRYEVDGRTYHSDRYDFVTGSSSGYEGKRQIVEAIPPGTETTCYYDPDEPWRAVLSRDFRADWLFALIPLLFMAVGAIGTIGSLLGGRRAKRRVRATGAEWKPATRSQRRRRDERAPVGGLVLAPSVSPWGRFYRLLVFTVLFDGVVGFFAWKWWQSYQAGSWDGCMTFVLAAFVLFGLLLLASVPYQFLAAFNPQPVLTFDRRRLEIGETANLTWRFQGSASRIRKLTVTVTGREEASYTRGTDRVTDRETFAELVVVDSEFGVGSGNARFDVPADTMHSFEAASNKIAWTLTLHGVIDNWPDVREEFPLVIHPKSL